VDTIALVPHPTFSNGALIDTYFEVYGAKLSDTLTTQIIVKEEPTGFLGRLGDALSGKQYSASIAYTESPEAIDPVAGWQQSMQLDTRNLRPGTYSLSITVTNQADKSFTTRSRNFVVRP
jgi:hypothetical protein